ncbi:Uncharacterised protein [Vibrio cholerae]|nr:Uncharacterised protein [Vibrio cholerae]
MVTKWLILCPPSKRTFAPSRQALIPILSGVVCIRVSNTYLYNENFCTRSIARDFVLYKYFFCTEFSNPTNQTISSTFALSVSTDFVINSLFQF